MITFRARTASIIFTTIILFVFQQLASKIGSGFAYLFNYSPIDPNNIFAYLSVHHLIQMLIAIIVIFVINKIKRVDFYLKYKHSKDGIKYTVIFISIMLVYVLLSYIIGYTLNTIMAYDYPLNTTNIWGTLGFQLLLSGPSEEILFRALPISIFMNMNSSNRDNNKRLFVPIICSSFLFSMAHISWTVFPFSIQINWFQLVYAFILGIVYAITYIKSKSLIYPMIMHSMSNVLMVGIGYIFMSYYH